MNYFQALQFLELDYPPDPKDIKEQYRWFIKTYHPDNKKTGSIKECLLAIQAYKILRAGIEMNNGI